MTQEQDGSSQEDLQFDKVEYKDSSAAQSASVCGLCQSALSGSYYQINGVVACPACKIQQEEYFAEKNSKGGILKALAFGIPAAIFGTVIYYAVIALTGYEFGLVALLIGWMVGSAVRKGSNNRGGLRFQIAAVVLTYISISLTYIPVLFQEVSEKSEQSGQEDFQPVSFNFYDDGLFGVKTAEAADREAEQPVLVADDQREDQPSTLIELILGFGIIFLLALAVPFLGGFQNIIGILIIGFALWEAWRLNKKTLLEIQGPFELKKSSGK